MGYPLQLTKPLSMAARAPAVASASSVKRRSPVSGAARLSLCEARSAARFRIADAYIGRERIMETLTRKKSGPGGGGGPEAAPRKGGFT